MVSGDDGLLTLAENGSVDSFELPRETYSHYWFNSGKPIFAIS
jgi:hypothetical protein